MVFFLRNRSKITAAFLTPFTLPSPSRGEEASEVIFERSLSSFTLYGKSQMIRFIRRIRSTECRQRLWGLLIATAIGTISCSDASAQFTSGIGGDGITATGSGQVDLEPKKLRLNMWIEAKGKDAKSAAKALASHQERVREDLVAMNAKADTVRFSTTRFKSGDSDQQRNTMRMMQRQMGSTPFDLAQQDAVPDIVTARSALQVEWDLPTTDAQALAILPEGLKAQVVNRDLAGKKNQPDLTEEQLEQLNEMSAMMEESMGSFGFDDSNDPSKPRIVYVAEAAPEQRQTAMKQAFEQARQSAELVAAAAGIELGALKSVAINEQQAEWMQAMRYAGYGANDNNPFAMASPGEVTSPTLDELMFRVALVVVYER